MYNIQSGRIDGKSQLIGLLQFVLVLLYLLFRFLPLYYVLCLSCHDYLRNKDIHYLLFTNFVVNRFVYHAESYLLRVYCVIICELKVVCSRIQLHCKQNRRHCIIFWWAIPSDRFCWICKRFNSLCPIVGTVVEVHPRVGLIMARHYSVLSWCRIWRRRRRRIRVRVRVMVRVSG